MRSIDLWPIFLKIHGTAMAWYGFIYTGTVYYITLTTKERSVVPGYSKKSNFHLSSLHSLMLQTNMYSIMDSVSGYVSQPPPYSRSHFNLHFSGDCCELLLTCKKQIDTVSLCTFHHPSSVNLERLQMKCLLNSGRGQTFGEIFVADWFKQSPF